MATTGSSGKSARTAAKVRKVAFDEFKNILPEVIAIATTQAAFQGAGKLSGLVRGAISGLGKVAGDSIDAGDVAKISGMFKSELRKENMPKSYNDKIEVVVDKYLDKMHSTLMIEDEAKRSLGLRELKRDLQDEVRILDQQYQELPFHSRIMAFLDDATQRKHDEMPMTPEQEEEYVKLRENIKSVDVFKRILEQSSDASDFIRRLKRNIATPPKPDPKKEFEKGVKQTMESGKSLLEAVDKGIKELFPYENLVLPDFVDKDELPKDYVARLVQEGALESYRETGEADDAFTQRLLLDRKFMGKVDDKVNESIRLQKIAKIRGSSTGSIWSSLRKAGSKLRTWIMT